MGERWLIVNADDFGQSAGVNRGVIESYERGIVTSASLMVRGSAAAAAAAYARAHPALDVGLHLDLGEWGYADSRWQARYEVVPSADPSAVRRELGRQLADFESLVGRPPTHLDSHQHVHLREPVRSLAIDVSNRLGVPLRAVTGTIHYCGAFYGQTAEGFPLPDAMSVDALITILEHLPAGTIELGCHPGFPDDFPTSYRRERAQEVRILCDARVMAALTRLQITRDSFAGIHAGQRA